MIGFDPVAERETFALPGPIGGGLDIPTRTALWIAARTVIVLGMILFGAKADAGESQKSQEMVSIEEEKLRRFRVVISGSTPSAHISPLVSCRRTKE
jgi:hypothetical protein